MKAKSKEPISLSVSILSQHVLHKIKLITKNSKLSDSEKMDQISKYFRRPYAEKVTKWAKNQNVEFHSDVFKPVLS